MSICLWAARNFRTELTFHCKVNTTAKGKTKRKHMWMIIEINSMLSDILKKFLSGSLFCVCVCVYVWAYPHRIVGTSVCLHTSTMGTFDIVGTFLGSPQLNCLQTLRFVEKRLFQVKIWRSPELTSECKLFHEGPHNVNKECKEKFINFLCQSYRSTKQCL